MNRNVLWKIVLILAVLVVFTVAIIPTTNNPEPIKRGLDLKGGIQLVMRVNVNEATRVEVDQAMNSMRGQVTSQNVPAPTMRRISDLAFLVMHDTYHVGQLGYVRKALGYEGVVG